MYVNFGVGFATILQPGTPQVPVVIGGLQDISVSIKFTKKKAYGNLQFPIAVARGEGELTWKAKSLMFSGQTIAAVLTGSSTTSGTVAPVASETTSVPASTPWTYTVTNGATFKEDLGVLDVAGGKYMTPVSAAPAAGQYQVNTTTGLYTFASADASKAIAISYSYTVAASGHTITYTNQLMGSGATVALDLFNTNPNQNKASGCKVFATIIEGLDFAFKNNDFMATDLSGEAFADSSGNVFVVYPAD